MAKPMKGVSSVTRNGTTYWYARLNGKKVYCGKGEKGLEMAEAARSKEVVKKYENREVNAGLIVTKPSFKKVRELCNWYMELPDIQAMKSYRRKVIASAHVLDYFGDKSLTEVEGDQQQRYKTYRRGQGAKDGTIYQEISFISSAFHLAKKYKKIDAQFMPGTFLRDIVINPRRTLNDEEYRKLLHEASPAFRDVLICGYESAMRSSEIQTLTPAQVHLDMRHISGQILNYIDLGIFDTKTGAKRIVPASPVLKALLKRRMKGLDSEDYIFTDENGKPWSGTKISLRMKAACEAAGIPAGDKTLNKKGERIGVVFHCLRHTRTTKWIEAGFSDEIIRRATGHIDLRAYQNYAKPDTWSIMRLVDKTDNFGTKSAQDPVISAI